MVAPVTHHPDVFIGGLMFAGEGDIAINSQGRTTQPAPYNIPTAYQFHVTRINDVDTNGWGFVHHTEANYWSTRPYCWPSENAYSGPCRNIFENAVNRAYGKFQDKLSEKAEFAVMVAERNQAASLMKDSASKLAEIFWYASTRQWKKLARALGVNKIDPKLIRKYGKNIGGLVMAYYYGWKPLISDIEAVTQLLSEEPPKGRDKLSAASGFNLPVYNEPSYGQANTFADYQLKGVVKLIARAAHFSDLYAVNRAGLNPITSAWNLLPFSHVVDWLANVSQWLNSSTDWVGLTLEDPQWLYKVEIRGVSRYTTGIYYSNVNWISKSYVRNLGHPLPTLNFYGKRLKLHHAKMALAHLLVIAGGLPSGSHIKNYLSSRSSATGRNSQYVRV